MITAIKNMMRKISRMTGKVIELNLDFYDNERNLEKLHSTLKQTIHMPAHTMGTQVLCAAGHVFD